MVEEDEAHAAFEERFDAAPVVVRGLGPLAGRVGPDANHVVEDDGVVGADVLGPEDNLGGRLLDPPSVVRACIALDRKSTRLNSSHRT